MAFQKTTRGKLQLETLESKRVMTSMPFGASADDTGEYMLGDVLVSVVAFESNGSIDPSTEDWTHDQIVDVKKNVRSGLAWWSKMLDRQDSVHSLNFKIDYTFTDNPVQTGYEPISRRSDDFTLWIEDFFDEVNLSDGEGFSSRIRKFNHRQRVAHDTNWAFTIFVVNSENDSDSRFRTDGSFQLAFAFAGGRFFVLTSERPAASVAHETAHMFWGMDEYAGSKSYEARRGYYNTQNLNARDGHPNPASRVRSIMDQQSVGYSRDALSTSAMETIGWKDSDNDGVFDVLDVPLSISGSGHLDTSNNSVRFVGSASAVPLPNQNPSGSGNAMTLNRVSRIEFRLDHGNWNLAKFYDEYQVDFDVSIPIGPHTETVEIRAVDDATGITSTSLQTTITRVANVSWHNATEPNDVSDDGKVSPVDALMVINNLNRHGSRVLPSADQQGGPPYFDVNDDGHVSPNDAVRVINALNRIRHSTAGSPSYSPSEADAEGENDPLLVESEEDAVDSFAYNEEAPNPLPLNNVRVYDTLFDLPPTSSVAGSRVKLTADDIDAAFAGVDLRDRD